MTIFNLAYCLLYAPRMVTLKFPGNNPAESLDASQLLSVLRFLKQRHRPRRTLHGTSVEQKLFQGMVAFRVCGQSKCKCSFAVLQDAPVEVC